MAHVLKMAPVAADDPDNAMDRSRLGWLLPYAGAVGVTALSLRAALSLLTPLDGWVTPLLLIAVMVSARFGGTGPGLLSATLTVLATDYFFVAPAGSLQLTNPISYVELAVFALAALLISSLAQGRRAAERAREVAEHAALHDALTSLPNRVLLLDRLNQTILSARRHRQLIGLLIVDLDGFKDINDRFGHECGDVALRQVAQRLRRALRTSDTVARMGGDEFAIVLPALTSADGADLAAEKIAAALAPPLDGECDGVVVGASVGIALFPRDGQQADGLLRQADAAMYRVKRIHHSGDRSTSSPRRARQVIEASASA